jgi:hypothetical protein
VRTDDELEISSGDTVLESIATICEKSKGPVLNICIGDVEAGMAFKATAFARR